jgi:hypothetical protein
VTPRPQQAECRFARIFDSRSQNSRISDAFQEKQTYLHCYIQSMKHNRITDNPDQTWIFQGDADLVDINIGACTNGGDGYVMAIQLASGAFRLAASRHPSKYMTNWRYNVKQFGMDPAVKVFVSRPYYRYESIKRAIASRLADHRVNESDTFIVPVKVLTEAAHEVFLGASTRGRVT